MLGIRETHGQDPHSVRRPSENMDLIEQVVFEYHHKLG